MLEAKEATVGGEGREKGHPRRDGHSVFIGNRGSQEREFHYCA